MTEQLDFDATSRVLDGDWPLHYHEHGSGPVLIMLHGSGPGVSGWSNFRANLPVFFDIKDSSYRKTNQLLGASIVVSF